MSEDPNSLPAVLPDIDVPSRAVLEPRRSGLAHRRAELTGTVYLLLDHSTSMADGDKLGQLERGALRFFGEAHARGYAVGLIAFADRARCLLGATRNPQRFAGRLRGLRPQGRTDMAGAIALACWRLRHRRGERVAVLITDGMPDSREATLRAARLARVQGVVLVAVGTDGADRAFLESLALRPELARHAPRRALSESVALSAERLPHPARFSGDPAQD